MSNNRSPEFHLTECDTSSSEEELDSKPDGSQTSFIEETTEHQRYITHNAKQTVHVKTSNNETQIDLSRSVLICQEYATDDHGDEGEDSADESDIYDPSANHEPQRTMGVSFMTEHKEGVSYRVETGPILEPSESRMKDIKLEECSVKQENIDIDSTGYESYNSEDAQSLEFKVDSIGYDLEPNTKSTAFDDSHDVEFSQNLEPKIENTGYNSANSTISETHSICVENDIDTYHIKQEDIKPDLDDSGNIILYGEPSGPYFGDVNEESDVSKMEAPFESDIDLNDSGDGLNNCPFCHESLDSSDIKEETVDSTIQCHHCRQWVFKKARTNDSGISKFQKCYKCKLCAKTYQIKTSLRSHEKSHLGKTKTYKCQFCEEMFHKKVELKYHVRTHTGEMRYQCRFCERGFKDWSSRKYHECREHTNTTFYQCAYCEKQFIGKGDWKKHESVHRGEKPYMCSFCGKTYNRRGTLREHEKTHRTDEKGVKRKPIPDHEKPYKCEFCEKRFKLTSFLKSHEKLHREDPFKFKCRFCEKHFDKNSHLKVHERVHTGETPYRCSFCGRAFKDSTALRKHERIHTGEKPYACKFCCKRFTQSNACKGHEKIHQKERKICPN